MKAMAEMKRTECRWVLCVGAAGSWERMLYRIRNGTVYQQCHHMCQEVAHLPAAQGQLGSDLTWAVVVRGDGTIALAGVWSFDTLEVSLMSTYLSQMLTIDQRPAWEEAVIRCGFALPGQAVSDQDPVIDLSDVRVVPQSCPDQTLSPALLAALDSGDVWQVRDVLAAERPALSGDFSALTGEANCLLARHYSKPVAEPVGGNNGDLPSASASNPTNTISER